MVFTRREKYVTQTVDIRIRHESIMMRYNMQEFLNA